jgi:hypothetical protein
MLKVSSVFVEAAYCYSVPTHTHVAVGLHLQDVDGDDFDFDVHLYIDFAPRSRPVPDLTEIRLSSKSSVYNWVCDTGDYVHVTPILKELVNMLKRSSGFVEAVDCYTVA